MRGQPLWPPAVSQLATRPSQSNPRGSGPEVLKHERGHVTSETGVAEVAVFGALQLNAWTWERSPQTMGIMYVMHSSNQWAAFLYHSGRYHEDANIALGPILEIHITYTIVWFLRAPCWYIGPTAMPRAAVTPIAPERSEGAIGCDSRPRHCRRDDIPAWRPNKITLLSLLPLDLTMYHRFISFLRAVQCREGR